MVRECMTCRSQWLRGLRRGSAALAPWDFMFESRRGTWISVCCELSDRGPCNRLITRPEESFRVWCVWAWVWGFDSEEALAHYWLLRDGEKCILCCDKISCFRRHKLHHAMWPSAILACAIFTYWVRVKVSLMSESPMRVNWILP